MMQRAVTVADIEPGGCNDRGRHVSFCGAHRRNEIEAFITQSTSQGGRGAALTIILMLFVAILMGYYLVTVSRASREARR